MTCTERSKDRTVLVLAALAGLSSTTAAQSVATEETLATEETQSDEASRIEALEARVAELEAAEGETVATGGKSATIKLFGRIHLDGWTFPGSDDAINVFETGDPDESPESNVQFRRARLGASGKIQEEMLYKLELDFGDPNDLVFKDLYFGFEDVPTLQTLLIGNQKRPYGLDHLNSSRYNVFLERPFVVEALNQDARRLGIAAYGTSEDEVYNWRYGIYLLENWANDGEIQGDGIQPELTGRFASTVRWEDEGRDYTHLAASGTVAWPDDGENGSRFRTRPEARSDSRWIDTGTIPGAETYGLVGLEGLANRGRLQVTGELMGTYLDRDSGFDSTQFWGGYLYAAWFLTDDYMPWSRSSGTLARIKPKSPLKGSGWGAWQAAARLSYADFTDEDVFGGEGTSLTLGLNWYWNSHARLQFNYIHGNIDDRSVDVGGTTYSDGDYDILGVRLMVDF